MQAGVSSLPNLKNSVDFLVLGITRRIGIKFNDPEWSKCHNVLISGHLRLIFHETPIRLRVGLRTLL